jgi:hypothetical protein
MPLELQVIRASEFIRVGTQGQLDLAASKTVLAELAGACRRRGVERALLDIREVRPGPVPVFTPQDLAALVDTFHEIGFTHEQRLAVLYSADPHKRARLFAFLSTLRGWSVRAFGEYEEALDWLALSGGDEADLPPSSGEQTVPVQSRSPEVPGPEPE